MTLGVLPSHRNTGMGSYCLHQILNRVIEEWKCNIVELDVLASNHGAIRLYLRNGFYETGRIREYYEINGKLHDAVHMVKRYSLPHSRKEHRQ